MSIFVPSVLFIGEIEKESARESEKERDREREVEGGAPTTKES